NAPGRRRVAPVGGLGWRRGGGGSAFGGGPAHGGRTLSMVRVPGLALVRRRRGGLGADDRHHVGDVAGLLRRRRGRQRRALDDRPRGRILLAHLEHLAAAGVGTAHLAPAQRGIDLEPRLAEGTGNGDIHGCVPPEVGDRRASERVLYALAARRETGDE